MIFNKYELEFTQTLIHGEVRPRSMKKYNYMCTLLILHEYAPWSHDHIRSFYNFLLHIHVTRALVEISNSLQWPLFISCLCPTSYQLTYSMLALVENSQAFNGLKFSCLCSQLYELPYTICLALVEKSQPSMA